MQRYCSVSHTLVLLQITKVPFNTEMSFLLFVVGSWGGGGGLSGLAHSSLAISIKVPLAVVIYSLFYGKEEILLCSESGVLPEIPCGLGPGFFLLLRMWPYGTNL